MSLLVQWLLLRWSGCLGNNHHKNDNKHDSEVRVSRANPVGNDRDQTWRQRYEYRCDTIPNRFLSRGWCVVRRGGASRSNAKCRKRLYTALHCIALHCIALHLHTTKHHTTPRHCRCRGERPTRTDSLCCVALLGARYGEVCDLLVASDERQTDTTKALVVRV